MARSQKPKHSLALRWMHWVNFPVLAVMIWSGLLIYWANDEYTLTLFGYTFFKFFPDSWYELFGLRFQLAKGIYWHFVVGWLFLVNGIAYSIYLFTSGHWRDVFPHSWRAFKDAILVTLHDLHLRKTAPPQGMYNAAQQIAYASVLIMGVLAGLSGLAIYKPVELGYITATLGGYEAARLIHFTVMVLLVLFFFVHVGQVIKTGWGNFESMVSGYDETPEQFIPPPPPPALVLIPDPDPLLPADPDPAPLPASDPLGWQVMEKKG